MVFGIYRIGWCKERIVDVVAFIRSDSIHALLLLNQDLLYKDVDGKNATTTKKWKS